MKLIEDFLIYCDQKYQRPSEDQKICPKQNYLNQELPSLTQLDWELHRELNSVVESHIAGNILICISQENPKLCHTSAFQRICWNLIVEISIYTWLEHLSFDSVL